MVSLAERAVAAGAGEPADPTDVAGADTHPATTDSTMTRALNTLFDVRIVEPLDVRQRQTRGVAVRAANAWIRRAHRGIERQAEPLDVVVPQTFHEQHAASLV